MNDQTKRDRTWADRASRWCGGLAALLLAALAFIWFVVLPSPSGLEEGPVTGTALIAQRVAEAAARGEQLPIRQEWVDGAHISDNLKRAVIVAEDYRFRRHRGIDWVSLAEEVRWTGGEDFSWRRPSDWKSLAEAVRYVWAHRSGIRGRSTITQQLAKNLYFGTDRSFTRKAFEFVVAHRLEQRLDKDRILELYLNVAEWGPGIFGAEAAARHYFGRSAADLTLSQAAALAGTLPHPLTSNPSLRPGRMRWRQASILARLAPKPPDVAPLPHPGGTGEPST